MDERLRKAESDAQLFNAREGLLGLPISDYSHVRNLIELFDPFLQFWTTSASWRVSLCSTLNVSMSKCSFELGPSTDYLHMRNLVLHCRLCVSALQTLLTFWPGTWSTTEQFLWGPWLAPNTQE